MPPAFGKIATTILSGLAVLTAITRPDARAAEPQQVLIATETSVFKDAVVARVAEALGRDGHTVRTIALAQLANEPTDAYQAVVLVNSCHAWRPRRDVRDFLARAGAETRKRLVIVTTAGSGECEFKAPGVDVLSSASKRTRIDDVARAILERVRARLVAP